MTKIPLAILDAMGVRAPRPKTSLGFGGRARMLELWDRMDADQQDQALLVLEGIVGRVEEPVVVPAVRVRNR